MRFLFAALSLVLVSPIGAADWPQFFGPERDGRSPEVIAATVPADGPEVVWRAAVGSGLAGPAVAAGRVILFHREGDEAVLQAWSVADGKPLWRHTMPTDYRDDFGFDNGPRSTPTLHGGRVLVYGADGRLSCVEAATGSLAWTRDLAQEMGSPKGWFGRACAPLVAGDLVLVQVGGRWQGKPAGVAAFRMTDGSVAWTASGDEASYSSPVVMSFTAGPAAVIFTRKGVELLDPASGRSLAHEPFEPEIAASVSACTPLRVGPDQFFLSGCYDLGAKVWSVGAGFALAPVWAKTEVMDCHYGTPVVHEGHLYGFHGRQEQGQELRCVSAAEGSVAWSTKLPAGSLVIAGSTLVVLTEKGELILAPATPQGFKPSGRGQILAATTRAFPALSNGLLFARDGKALVAVRLSGKKDQTPTKESP